MRKKTRHQMYVKPGKSKVMKTKDQLHDMEDMDDMCDMDEMEDMDAMEDMAADKACGCDKPMGMDKDMCAKFPECILLAHAYVPWQTYEKAFTPPEALMKGTLFPELWGVYRIPK